MAINGLALQKLMERQKAEEAEKANEKKAGRATSSQALVAYTPEREREVKEKPAFVTYRSTLQNADGSFKFAPDPLGTGALIPGRYYVNTFGKYMAY